MALRIYLNKSSDAYRGRSFFFFYVYRGRTFLAAYRDRNFWVSIVVNLFFFFVSW